VAMGTTKTPEQEHTLVQTEVLCAASWSWLVLLRWNVRWRGAAWSSLAAPRP